MLISEVLRNAANNYLCDNEVRGVNQSYWSCNAVEKACDAHHTGATFRASCLKFLRTLGCEVNSGSLYCGYGTSKEVQTARFLRLDFAACVAEDLEKNGEI
jgi:hypothetical protein